MVEEATQTTEATEKSEETKPEMVSKERMDEVTTKNRELEEQNELLRQNQALISANTVAAPQTKQIDPFEAAGLDPNEPNESATQEQHKKILGHYMGGVRSEIDQLRFVADHPDFPALVGTAEQIKTGQWAAPLMKAIKANPTLMSTIVNSANSYAAAYSVAKIQADKDKEGDKTKTTRTEAQQAIDEAVENSNKVKTSANAPGGEGLSEEGRTANMSDAEFIAEFNKSGGQL